MSVMNKRSLLVGTNKPLVIEEKPIPEPAPKGLVLKTHYSGICHSDYHLVDGLWDDGKNKLPWVLGHEIAGEVHSIGKEPNQDAPDLKVGDKVAIMPFGGCHNCALCKAGENNLCDIGLSYTIGCSDVEGGYQQYVAIEDRFVAVKIPDNVPIEVAAILSCSGLTAYNAFTKVQPTLEKFVKIEGRSTLVVIGGGGLGQWGIQLARALLPKSVKVVCVDRAKEKLPNALRAGADDAMVWGDKDTMEDITSLTRRVCEGKVHGFIDFVNSSTTNSRAFSQLARGGIIAPVGLYGLGGKAEITLDGIALNGIAIQGIVQGTLNQMKALMTIVSTKNLKSPPIIKVGLEEAYDYIMRLKAGTVDGRAVIDFVNK